jgi:drug/metabolite transporter (DMT)-like permease
LFYGGGMLFQTTGLRWTLPSVSGFLTSLAVVFAPQAQALILRRRVGAPTWSAIAIAIVGTVLLCWPKPEAYASNTQVFEPPVKYLGEIFTILSSLLFTGQILAVDAYGQRANPARLTLVMLITTSIASLVGAAALGGVRWSAALGACVSDRTLIWTVATLVVISSVGALHLMNQYQPLVSPAVASVVYCTEPLFATTFSIAFRTEKLTGMTVAGGMVVLASVLIVALAPSPDRNAQPGSA